MSQTTFRDGQIPAYYLRVYPSDTGNVWLLISDVDGKKAVQIPPSDVPALCGALRAAARLTD